MTFHLLKLRKFPLSLHVCIFLFKMHPHEITDQSETCTMNQNNQLIFKHQVALYRPHSEEKIKGRAHIYGKTRSVLTRKRLTFKARKYSYKKSNLLTIPGFTSFLPDELQSCKHGRAG